MPEEAIVVDEQPSTAAPAAPPAGAPATPATGAPAGQDEQPGKAEELKPTAPEKSYTQSELRAAIARENARLQRRMERELPLRIENEILKRQVAGTVHPQQAKPDAHGSGDQPPRQEDFKDWYSYNRAVVRYEAQQLLREQSQKGEREAASAKEYGPCRARKIPGSR